MKHTKLFNFILCIFLLAVLLPSAVYADYTKSLSVERNGVNVTGKNIFVDFEGIYTVDLVFDPTDADVDITVTSSNNNIAEAVYDGSGSVDITTYSKQGSATITVKDNNSNLKTTFRVAVQKLTEDISFSGASEVFSGKNTTMKVTVLPDSAKNKSVIWGAYKAGCDPSGVYSHAELADTCTVSHDVAISSNGVIVGKQVPDDTTVVIVLCAADGGAECAYNNSFTVKPMVQKLMIYKNGKDVSSSTVYMDYEETDTWDIIYEPNTADTNFVITSSNSSIVDAQENSEMIDVEVKAATQSSATVSVKDLISGRSASVRVMVQPLTKELEITQEDGETEVYVGETLQLTGKVKDPENAANKNLIWTVYTDSCDPEFIDDCEISQSAVVSSTGLVTGKAADDVKVVICPADGGAECEDFDLTIKPVAEYIKVTLDGDEVLPSDIVAVESGGTIELKAESAPDATAETEFDWKSSNTKIAEVDTDGKVTGISKGVAVITVSSKITTVKRTIKVRVLGKAVTDVEIFLGSPDNLNDKDQLVDGRSQQLTAVITPSDADIKTVNWSITCTDPADCANGVPATISATGKVTATHVNQVTKLTVTAEATDGSGKFDEYEIEVAPRARALYILDEDTVVTLSATGDPLHFHANDLTNKTAPIIKSLNSTDKSIQLSAWLEIGTMMVNTKDVVWSSSNPKIAIVDSTGKVTFLQSGTVTITAKMTDGSNLSRKATLTAKYLVDDILVWHPKDIHVLASGKTLQLKATALPSNAKNKKVRWYTDDPHVATVNPSTGKVTAAHVTEIKTVNIYAVSTDVNAANQPIAESNKYPITVYPSVTGVNIYDESSVLINGMKIVIELTDPSFTLTADTVPSDAANEVVWSTSNKKVLDVDQTGLVTPMGKGTATITAKAMDGSGKTAKVTFIVGVKSSNLELLIGANNSHYIDLTSGKSTKLIAQITPGNATNKKIFWEVGNTNVITNIKGNAQTVSVKIKDVSEKLCTYVTAYTTDGSALDDTVFICATPKVKAVKIYDADDNSDLTGQTLVLDLGDDIEIGTDIYAKSYPDDAEQDWVWSTSSNKILPFDGTTFYADKEGKAVITAKAIDGSGKTAKFTVWVVDPLKSDSPILDEEMPADENELDKTTPETDPTTGEVSTENPTAEELAANGDIDSLVAMLMAEDTEDTATGPDDGSAADSSTEEGEEGAADELSDTDAAEQPAETDGQDGDTEIIEQSEESETNEQDAEPAVTGQAEETEEDSAETVVESEVQQDQAESSEPVSEDEQASEEPQTGSEETVPAVETITVDVADDLITVTGAETFTLESWKLSVLPAEADRNTLTFEIEDETVAELESDEAARILEEGLKIKALAAGETKLVIKSGDVEKTIRIVVLPAVVIESATEETDEVSVSDNSTVSYDDFSGNAEEETQDPVQDAPEITEPTLDSEPVSEQPVEEQTAEGPEEDPEAE